jgi:serine phosphatase RsbU (regulator of sigma subunit)
VSTNPTLEDLYFSHLAANAPPAFVEKIRTAPYLEKERRMVTAILFTIANADEFTKHIPEEKRDPILSQALDQFAKIIYEYEGTIAKLWENTVLAFFGAPITHEDDPFRAIHAAKSLLAENKTISSRIESEFNIPMKLNIVLNTGPILVGDVKSNLKYDFISLNNTLECLDFAVCSQIPACEVLLFQDTYQFIKPYIDCHKVSEIYCEDTHSTLTLWQLDAITREENNLVRMPISHNTPMIGRKKELDMLMELTETVLAGLGRVGVIVGDSGIGKSRLIMEWKRSLRTLHQPTRLRWIESQGLSFGRELAFHLLKNLLRSALGVSENTSVEEIKISLQETLSNLLSTNADNIYLFLAHLLEIPLSDSEENQVHQLNALELRAKYLVAIQTFFRKLAYEQPLIIILEDLHWADPSSVDILIELLTLTSSAPILFCLVSRPERDSSGWRLIRSIREKIGTRLTRIEMENLDEGNSQTLVKQLIEVDEIPLMIRQVVLGKSEGNPLFIEELIRMLINEGVLVKNEDEWIISTEVDLKKIPDSVQGLLTARIDRLPPDARLTLRVASVIGRFFSERAIEKVMATYAPDIKLIEQLNTLESIGMIKVAQVNPELIFKFQHILLYDAAYSSIFDEDRASLHLGVGEVLEKLYPDNQSRLASQLAHHFMEGKEKTKALKYLDIAGHVAMDSYVHAEAETYFREAISIAKDKDQLAHLYNDLGEALAQQTKHREAIKAWKNAIQMFKELNHNDHLARAYARSARSAWWGYDPKHSLDICLEGLKTVEGASESPDIAYLYQETGRAYFFNNLPDDAKLYCEKALELARRLNAYDVQAEALATIGILPTTQPDDAVSALEMAVQISEVNQLYAPAARAYINLAAVMDNFGKVSLAREYRLRAVDLSNKGGGISDETIIHHEIIQDSLWLADFKDAEKRIEILRQSSLGKSAYLNEKTLDLLFLQGTYLRFKGDFEKAIEVFSEIVERSRQIHDSERAIKANIALAEVILEPSLINEENETLSNINLAHNIINDAINPVKNLSPGLQIFAHCLLSEIYTIQGDFTKAEISLKTSSTQASIKPTIQDQIRILFAQSRLEAARGDIDSALGHLSEGIQSLENNGGRWWRSRFWLEMGNHHLKRNEPEDVDQAQGYFRESLGEFKELDVAYYPEALIEKLRQVKHKSRAQAIAHRIVNQELTDAARVQHTFIPNQSPNIPGFDISSVLLPARETSGDFFDFIFLENGKLGIVIADVGDKGAGAALYMAMSRTLIRTYAGENQLPPEEVIRHVNRRILSDTQRGIFLTVFFGVLDPDQGTLTYVNAGHNPPFRIKTNGQKAKITSLNKTGPLVGIFPENSWEEKTINLEPNEILVFYTDGITEAQNKVGEFYETNRFKEYLEDSNEKNAELLRNGILENVHAFTGNVPRLDDITLIVLVRQGDQSAKK